MAKNSDRAQMEHVLALDNEKLMKKSWLFVK